MLRRALLKLPLVVIAASLGLGKKGKLAATSGNVIHPFPVGGIQGDHTKYKCCFVNCIIHS